jgi:hypothetical protein
VCVEYRTMLIVYMRGLHCRVYARINGFALVYDFCVCLVLLICVWKNRVSSPRQAHAGDLRFFIINDLRDEASVPAVVKSIICISYAIYLPHSISKQAVCALEGNNLKETAQPFSWSEELCP